MNKNSRLKKELFRLWQECQAIIWKHGCGWCMKPGPITGHHIIIRNYKLTAWKLLNGIGLCDDCHRKVHDDEHADKELLEHIRNKWPHIFNYHAKFWPLARRNTHVFLKHELIEIRSELKRFIETHNDA